MHGLRLHALWLFLAISLTISAQDTQTRVATVTLKDGSELVGEVLLENEEQIVLETESLGKVNILRKEIGLIGYGNAFQGRVWRETLDDMRNIVGPATGYNLPRGRAYIQNHMLLINQFYVGVTDNFSLGGGLELLSAFGDPTIFPTVGIFPKYTFPIVEGKANAALGALLLSTPDTRSAFDLNVFYGAFTYGPRGRNVSFGLGYVMNEGEFNSSPVFSLGGQYRLSPGLSLAAESWFGEPMEGSFFSFGVRLFGKRRSTWDIMFIGGAVSGEVAVSPVPLVGWTIPF
ncbi:MAG: hypothetical protein KDD06_26130 [Phaeodactylibacter sp.]|nr:hypothetical protein [Phaeodactylibacter sp.]MCB9266912.1 hypothetical protein [Lewinellaceae bacterium]MCB9290118.1 hypothetical protein [Lewinellaceae bacterium]